ncbi:MAG: UDP-N-acetylglucosamine 2-epimerase [Aurantimicrobium sp.]
MPEPEIIITNGVKGRPLSSAFDTLRWLLSINSWLFSNKKNLTKRLGTHSIILVHGDTMTSVVGSFIAKVLGTKIGHVEAGLRSGTWRHPFPEELDRRIVGKMADVHYAPSSAAVAALEPRPNIVFTHGNTALDALVERTATVASSDKPPYGLVLLHRFEFLNNSKLVTETISTLESASPLPLVIVADDHAKHVISAEVDKLNSTKITVIDKLVHQDFVQLATNAEFVVTDSGGVQEEMGFLGTPTLIHRKATERSDGLGRNVSLSDWSIETLTQFLTDYKQHKYPVLELEYSPSDIIVNDLRERGYGQK